MASGAELGKAYVQIIPSAQGIGGQISSLLGGEATSAGQSAGASLGSSLIGALSGVIAAAGIGKMVTDAITTGMDFDKSMSQVAATMGTTVDQIGELRDFAKEMGATTAFSATQAADALNYMALAGYDAETSMNMLPNVLNLAAAGGIELAQASDMVTDAQTALGLSLDETSMMVDQMAKASSKSNTSVAQLGDAFLTIGANARQARGGTAELSTVLGVLADNGIKGSEAGTHLRNIMLAMNPTTNKAVNAWEKLGVSAYDAEGNLRSLPAVFEDLNHAMEGMTEQEKTDMFSAMFNKTDLASIQALVGTSSERFMELKTEIMGAWYSTESLSESFSGMGVDLSNVEGNLSKLGITTEDFELALKASEGSAEEFLSYISEMAPVGTTTDDILNTMGVSLEDLQAGFDGASGAAQAMADTQLDNLAGDITLAQSAFEGLQIALSEGIAPMLRDIVAGAGTFMQDLTAAISSGDTDAIFNIIKDGLSTAIQGAFDAIISGNNFLAENADQIVTMGMDLVTTLALGIIENAPALVQSGVNCAIAFGQALINYDWLSLGAELLTALQGLIPTESATSIMQPILDGITAALPGLLSTGIEIITNLANGILAAVPQLLTTAGELIIQFADFLLQNAPTLLLAAADLVVNLANGIINNLPQIISTAQRLMMELSATLIKNMPLMLAAGVQVIIKIAAGLIQAQPQLWSAVLKTCQQIAENFKKFDWIGLGKSVIDGIIKGVQSAGDALITAILNMCRGAFDAVKKFFGIASPSKLMANEIGKYIPEGIAMGIEENAGVVDDAIHDMVMDTATSEALTEVSFASPSFQAASSSEGAILARMDAMLSLMERYFPEMADNNGEISITAINKSLGAAYA